MALVDVPILCKVTAEMCPVLQVGLQSSVVALQKSLTTATDYAKKYSRHCTHLAYMETQHSFGKRERQKNNKQRKNSNCYDNSCNFKSPYNLYHQIEIANVHIMKLVKLVTSQLLKFHIWFHTSHIGNRINLSPYALCCMCMEDFLPDTSNCGLRMHRECRERFLHHRLQRKPLISDPSMHHVTCVTHAPWCMSGSLTRGGGENVLGIPSVFTTHNCTYLTRDCLPTLFDLMCIWPRLGSLRRRAPLLPAICFNGNKGLRLETLKVNRVK